MAAPPEIVTARDLDDMTPNERAKVFDEHLVRDLEEVPAAFRARVEATGRQLAAELGSATGE